MPTTRHPTESPPPSTSSIPPTPKTRPFPPRPQAAPSAPGEFAQSAPCAKLFPLPKPQKVPALIPSRLSKDKCSSTAHFHARDPAPLLSSATSLRPLTRSTPHDPSSPPAPAPSRYSQSPHHQLCETRAKPLCTSKTALSNLSS